MVIWHGQPVMAGCFRLQDDVAAFLDFHALTMALGEIADKPAPW